MSDFVCRRRPAVRSSTLVTVGQSVTVSRWSVVRSFGQSLVVVLVVVVDRSVDRSLVVVVGRRRWSLVVGRWSLVVGRSIVGRSIVGRSIVGRSIVGRSIAGRSIVGRSIVGRPIVGRSVELSLGASIRQSGGESVVVSFVLSFVGAAVHSLGEWSLGTVVFG